MNSRTRWGQPPSGWSQPQLPGWAPLVDNGPLPLRAASSAARWWWPTVAVTGFLAVVVQVLDDDDPTPGLSRPGLLTIGLAAAVVVLLTVHRTAGPGALGRAAIEYAVVALLAALLVAPGGAVDQPPPTRPARAEAQAQTASGDDRPGVLKAATKVVRAVTGAARAVAGAVRWLIDLRRQADQQTTPDRGEAMAAASHPRAPSVPFTRRSP